MYKIILPQSIKTLPYTYPFIIILNKATDKELISKIYKLNSRKINDPIKQWAKELNRHFFREDIMAKKYMKRC